MTENYYIAITIGPILDTMSLASKPAALWASSYLFSFISRRLCERIKNAGVPAENFVTPFFPSDKNNYKALFCRRDGVGMFHDHIIFKDSDLEGKSIAGKLGEIRSEIVKDAAEVFGIDPDFLREYLTVAVVRSAVENGENPILHFGKLLDCAELSKNFKVSSTGRELLDSFTNEKVKKIGAETLKIDTSLWQLLSKGGSNLEVKAIGDISSMSGTPKMKKNDYFCILRADVDNASSIISSLSADVQSDDPIERERQINEKLRGFSEVCFRYCEKLAEAVRVFGGITIYAGGDDLLALLPCEGNVIKTEGNGNIKTIRGTVFELIGRINTIFDDSFKVYIDSFNQGGSVKKRPSVSYGLFISFIKFPLYEALERSASLLFRVAKCSGEEKNCAAVELRKHSGQSIELLISNDALPSLIELAKNVDVIGNTANVEGNDKEKTLLSAAQKLILFEALFSAADPKNTRSLFMNTFDADFHFENSSEFLHNKLPLFYNDQCLSGKIKLYENDNLCEGSYAKTLGQVLRMIKFFVEEGGDSQ